MTIKNIYFGTLGTQPSLFTAGLLNVTSNSQNTFYDYSKIKTGSAKDRPSSYFPKKTHSYFVVILGEEKYDQPAAQRLLRSVLYAKYIGIPIVCFAASRITVRCLSYVTELEQKHKLYRLMEFPQKNILIHHILLAHILDVKTEGYPYSNDQDIYKELRKLHREKIGAYAHAKLSAKLLEMPQKELDIILGQPTYWQLRFFVAILSEKLATHQAEFQTSSSLPSEKVGGEIEILQAEAARLSEMYAELLSRKVIGKLNHLEKIDSPQTLVNLAKKYYQIYGECLARISFMKKQKFSPSAAIFANKFISKYRAVTEFVDNYLAETKSQLKDIPWYEKDDEDKDYGMTYYFSLYPPEDIISEFTEWVAASQTKKTQVSLKAEPSERTVYRFRADLVDSKPKIWRRFEVDGQKNMLQLAQIIITLFNMDGSHLYSLTNLIGDQKRREAISEFKEKSKLELDNYAKNPDMNTVEDLFSLIKSLADGVGLSGNIEYLMPGDDGERLIDNDVEIQPGETLLEDSQAKEKTKFLFEYDFGDYWCIDLKVEKIEQITSAEPIPTTVLKGKGSGIIEDIGGIPGLLDCQEHPENYDVFGARDDFQKFDLEETNALLRELGL